ncbi:hypothetical protein IAU60_006230 [Kwoniella sp. DSM 27419]
MPRRKNAYLSDGSDSDASGSGVSGEEYNSQEDDDSRAERRLFEHKGKKRRMGGRSGKESAWEGIFGEDDDAGRAGRGLGAKRNNGGVPRSDWTKAPTFVSSATSKLRPDTLVDGDDTASNRDQRAPTASKVNDDEDEASEAGTDDSEGSEDDSSVGSPRVRDEEEEDVPRRGMGLGVGNGFARAGTAPISDEEPAIKPTGCRGGIGSARRGRGGIGSFGRSGAEPSPPQGVPSETPRGGLGSADAPANPVDDLMAAPPVPTAFGRPPPSLTASSGPPRKQQSFLARPTPASSSKSTTELTPAERAHFSKISSSFGARMLAKQGWEAGKGLGAQEDGRAVPIQVGKVFRGQGIQKGMRTEDSKREAKRMGVEFSDEEDEKPKRGKGRSAKGPKEPRAEVEQGWKKQKKIKVKVEHKTYEQLLAEAGESTAPGAGVGLVLDARGGELKEVQSLASLSLSTWTPTSDSTRLPELRHNLRLIVDVARGDVEGLIREGKSVNERRRWALREEQIARAKVEETEKRVTRLQQVQKIVSTVSAIATAQSTSANPSMNALTGSFNSLLDDYQAEYKTYSLDDVVVGAIAQTTRQAFADWQPFDISSEILISSLKPWQRAYNLPQDRHNDALTTLDGDRRDGPTTNASLDGERQMTAWESLLWSLWVPKVRSAINNDWDPASPHAAVHLLESWAPILPAFIRDNVLDQLVLPKVKAAIEKWDPRRNKHGKQQSLASIVFPWLPLLGERAEEILEGAKRRIRSVLRKWVVKDGVPEELGRWRKDVYSSREWDQLIIDFVLRKLGASLREDFTINPRKQDMVPLSDWVLPWHTLIRSSTFSSLLEANFFPKWLDILYIWLIQPAYKPDEVANWFVWWKSQFPQAVLDMRGVNHGFNSGLELMNQAMKLGIDAPANLQKPVFEALPPQPSKSSRSTSKTSKPTAASRPAEAAPDITFRSIAEDFAAQHDLIFLPVGRSHQQTGKPLFKVSKGVDGRGGVTVYIGEAAVFAQVEEGEFRAVSLEDMVKRATT